MKKKKLIGIISGLGISLLTIASVVSCTTTQNNSQNVNSKTANKIVNSLTTYFNNNINQMALLTYLSKNDYIIYTNDKWGYDENNGYTSWDNALDNGIINFIFDNENISYDGILGSNIDNNDFSVTSASYSTSGGLKFNIVYDSISASNSVTISANTLSNYNESNTSSNVAITNNLTTYFNSSNNQMALVNYLLDNKYIAYSNGTWNYNKNDGYTSWTTALSNGISAFIASNQNVSYGDIFGSNMNVGQSNYNNVDHNVNDLLVTNASYSTNGGLMFKIVYNGIGTSSIITISASTLSNCNKSNNSSNVTIANDLTTYFNSSNNQIALITYLLSENYITYTNETWNYYDDSSNSNNNYSSWTSALSSGISAFIASNQNISYGGVLGSNIDNNDLSIKSASYSAANGLVFNIKYNGINASTSVTISVTNLNNFINENTNIANSISDYFSEFNNQMTLVNYLLNDGYITYTNGTWNYENNNYSNWTSALSSGISAFIANNQNIYYGDILGSSIEIGQSNHNNVNDFLVTSASYSAANGLVFTITYNGFSASSSVIISIGTLNNYNENINSSNTAIVNALTTYFNNSNNQMSLINYLWNHNYIKYSNETWNYENNNYSSWTDALSSGISSFIANNQNISYDGILGSNMNVGQYNGNSGNNNANDLSITSTSYSTAGGLVFKIVYDGISTSSSVTISATNLNNFINGNINVANALTTYFNNDNNKIILIDYLLNNNYITYFNRTWSYNTNNLSAPNNSAYKSWTTALSGGINAFIANNQNISYDGVLGSNINISQSNYDNGTNNANDLSITSASYSTNNGLVFNITYNGINASSNVIISTSTLNNFISGNTNIANAISGYFGESSNQMTLINYLLNYNYITYTNGKWNYYDSSIDGYDNYSSWTDALSRGISSFIASNQTISYDGVLGSNINTNDLSITSASYSTTGGLVFKIVYDGISASSSIAISATTLNNSIYKNTNIINALITYFSNSNNQIALINYLVNNNYITYVNGMWDYDSIGYSDWTSALSNGISSFISNNEDVSYDGVFGWSINVGQLDNITGSNNVNDLSITSASYSTTGGLVFKIAYNGISISSSITIFTSSFSQYNESSNVAIAHALTTYFSDSNNQMTLINYLLNYNYITYNNGTWNYYDNSSNSNDNYSSLTSALNKGINAFIVSNQNISYDGVFGSNIDNNDLSVTSASYSTSGVLVFDFTYNNVSASSSVTISVNTLNNVINTNTNVVNALTTYFSDINNQIALINFLLDNGYIIYSNGIWDYDSNYHTSWINALESGISWFIVNNQNISYDGISGSNINNNGNLSIIGASYSAASGLVFNIVYNNVSASSSITISNNTLNNYSQTTNNLSNSAIANALTTYFSNKNNQIILINYLLNDAYITCIDGTWNYDKVASVPNDSSYTSWAGALGSGISSFIVNNQTISYDGISGSSIDNYIYEEISIIASYSADSGLVFNIVYNNAIASSSVIISTSTLNSVMDANIKVANALTSYFNDSNNQMALINYLLNNNYITYINNKLSYNNQTSAPNDNGYYDWDNALLYGIESFISGTQNIYYDGIYGSNIYISELWITNASYSATSGLVFDIAYNRIGASSNVIISNSILDNFINGNTNVANTLTTYFSSTNNQIALINSLLGYYITYSNGTWNYDDTWYSSWDDALGHGISSFISNNENVSYDGLLGSEISSSAFSVTNASYSASKGLVFTITYRGMNAIINVTISTSVLNQCNKTTNNSSNTTIANALTNYFSDSNNQIVLITYLLSANYITYTNEAWNYYDNSSNSNDNYSSWTDALSRGISVFIGGSNQNISYDGILGSNINTNDLSVISASYSTSDGLVFNITYNGVSASSNVTIFTTLNNFINTNINVANDLTNYFSNSNNQMALVNYLINNNDIAYSNGTWNYDSYGGDYKSWDDALSSAISSFIYSNQNISYDGILNWSININALSVTSASYSAKSGFVFNITYNWISASSNVTIFTTLNTFINTNINVANDLTNYLSNSNNQMTIINFLLDNGYITYSNDVWNYNNSSWTSTLTNGINSFIASDQNIYYDGVLGSSINTSINTNALSVTSASYSAKSGLVFNITYNGVSASSNVIISTTLNNFINTNINVANDLNNYFSNSNNQMALINYLLHNNYITYEDGTWSYDTTSSSLNNYSSFTSWASALVNGISAFISANSNILYGGIFGSQINTNNLEVYNNVSYSASSGLVFTIVYNGFSGKSIVTISNNTLNQYNENINSSDTTTVNALITYFSNENNQMTLINYLLDHKYITYSNGTWNYDSSNYSSLNNDGSFTSWDDALSSAISNFIYSNQNISYDGILGSSINTDYLSVTSASYSAKSGLVFNITYNGVSVSNSVTIPITTLNNSVDINTNVANTLTTYFSSTNNQKALVNYLLNNGLITYENQTWNYDSSDYYSSWVEALSRGISWFISNNENISYDGILGSNINTGSLSITSASYNASSGLVFSIAYNNINASSNVTISTILNNFANGTTNIANALTTYFNNSNNQMALINYLLNNKYITYSNETWTYNSNNDYASWASALTNGISAFVASDQNISYDNILGSSIDVGQYNTNFNSFNANNLSITSASYNSSNGLVLTIAYNNVNANSNITISNATLNDSINSNS